MPLCWINAVKKLVMINRGKPISTNAARFSTSTAFSQREEAEDCKYENHINSTTFQKSLLAIGSAVTALIDPSRADMVAVLGEATGTHALKKMRDKMESDQEGAAILREMPRISSSTVDLKKLRSLQDGTLGKAYVKWLDINGVSPDTRLPVQFVDNAELAYVMQRYREVHDLIHTVLGMPTNMLGEVTVKWIEGIQTELPMCVGGGIIGAVRLKPKQRQRYLSTYLPWAIRVGQQSKFLMNIYYERRWEQDLQDLRWELGIESPPE